MELEPTDFDLPGAIDNALTLVRERAGRRGVTLGRAIDGRLGTIRGDERKVKQVLLNLLSNALKFTPEGGRIDVRAAVTDELVEVSVSGHRGGHRPRGSGGGVRGVSTGGHRGKEGGGHGTRARPVPEVHRAARRSDLGQEPGGTRLDVHVHVAADDRSAPPDGVRSRADPSAVRRLRGRLKSSGDPNRLCPNCARTIRYDPPPTVRTKGRRAARSPPAATGTDISSRPPGASTR